jgi:hypothetical protein
MLSIEEIQARVRQRPFRPFRIVSSSGESVEVTHPELILVGQSRVVVGRASPRRPSAFTDTVELARMHITALEDLPAEPSTDPGAGPSAGLGR